jgi:hypothetical protein
MSSVEKISEEELDFLKTIQLEYQNITFQIGEMEIAKNTLLKKVEEIELKSKGFLDNLYEKYGDKTINIETGGLN